MWKIVLGAVLALPLTATATAGAATIDVSITKTAYTPSTASVSTADSGRHAGRSALAGSRLSRVSASFHWSTNSFPLACRSNRRLSGASGA
jgi:hypothetical protein